MLLNICRIQSTTKQHWHLYKCWLYASHWLLGSRKGFKNHTRIRLCMRTPLCKLCIDFTCSRWTTWICEIISWGQFTDVGRYRRFIRVIKCKQPVCFITHRLLTACVFCGLQFCVIGVQLDMRSIGEQVIQALLYRCHIFFSTIHPQVSIRCPFRIYRAVYFFRNDQISVRAYKGACDFSMICWSRERSRG